MKTISQTWDVFDHQRPATPKIIGLHEGHVLVVMALDSGLQRTYRGLIKLINDKTFQCGDDVLLYECVRRISLP